MRLLWTAGARRDLDDIFACIAAGNRAAAERVDEEIVRAAEGLRELPYRGRPGRKPGTRELVVPGRPYVLVYAVRGETLVVLRALHGARRWPA
jgi:toxin ParE1/3/4